MSELAISVQGLSKSYAIGRAASQRDTLYDSLSDSLAGLFRRSARTRAPRDESQFWALRDIDFRVHEGEVIGIIGRNGAGKSTLLKILSRITPPTSGRVEIRGRLASLLEVGTGFHPELSGRENIFLNGAILGMRRAEVAKKFDQIVDFAEVVDFVDTPVKRYSSGMYVRLAFAVAAHLEPDILVVDEVLAVGDAAFQAKCLGKMGSVGRAGTTVLIVSHNMALMHQLCRRALLLEGGRLAAEGELDKVAARYVSGRQGASSGWSPSRRDNESFQYESVEILDSSGRATDIIPANQPFQILFSFSLARPLTGRIAFTLRNHNGVVVLTSSNTDRENYLNKTWSSGAHTESCTFPGGWLSPGAYWLTISRPLSDENELIEDACRFTIDSTGSLASRDSRTGILAPLLDWREGRTP